MLFPSTGAGSALAWAGMWGLIAGSALLLGAALGYFTRVSQRFVAGVTAFGAGVLISALSIELMDEAHERGGFGAAAIGFLAGALAYTLANVWLARRGARHRKRSGEKQPSEAEHPGSGLAIAVGALLDGVPESIAIGVSMIQGAHASALIAAAIFLSNVPEGLSSSIGMKRAGRSGVYIFGVWGGIALICALSALLGYGAFAGFTPSVIAVTLAIAAGAILAMVADTMIPEAFAEARDYTGLLAAFGFLTAFLFAKLSE
jgi:zinc transporter, ZIP family